MKRNSLKNSKSRRGYFVVELMISLGMATALLIALTMTIGKEKRAERQMATTRAEVRTLEAALLAIQSGGAPVEGVTIERIPGAAPPGMAWVRATLKDGDAAKRNLVGLVEASKAPAREGERP